MTILMERLEREGYHVETVSLFSPTDFVGEWVAKSLTDLEYQEGCITMQEESSLKLNWVAQHQIPGQNSSRSLCSSQWQIYPFGPS